MPDRRDEADIHQHCKELMMFVSVSYLIIIA
jgi:hypothetical protein